MSASSPEIAVIGGGTGSFTLLQDLKDFTPNLAAIVNMCDDGGSTGVLRDELGVLPPGDARQCLVALSESPDVRDLFSYRFADGRYGGQSLGNIIISGLELQHGSFAKAIEVASGMLRITGAVIPATLDNHNLVMHDGDETIDGEFNIGHRTINDPDAHLTLRPPAAINPEAEEAIERADIVVIAPGNLYGSILPILAIDGMPEAIAASKATTVSVTNLVTKPGQTDNWHVVDYARQLERYLGEGQIDHVLYNNTPLSDELLRRYAAEGEYPVSVTPERFGEVTANFIGAHLVADEVATQDPSDTAIKRTLIRHDAKAVGRQLMRIYWE